MNYFNLYIDYYAVIWKNEEVLSADTDLQGVTSEQGAAQGI